MGVGVSLRPCGVKGPCGPPFLGAPIRLPCVTIYLPWGPGAPSAGLSHPVFRPGPAHFGSSADPHELFHLNRTACRAVSAAHRSSLQVRHYATSGTPGPQLWRTACEVTSFAPEFPVSGFEC